MSTKDFNEEAVLVTATALSFGMSDEAKTVFKSTVRRLLRMAYLEGMEDVRKESTARIDERLTGIEGVCNEEG